MKKINIDELKEKMTNEDIKLIDVLEPEQYEKKHIKNAINIPLKKIATEAKQRFDKDDELVVYCADYECSASPTAAKKLENSGFENVYDYAGGKKEWEDAGYPMQ
jgi:rhodanese-related sulfurtransferase